MSNITAATETVGEASNLLTTMLKEEKRVKD